MKKKILSGSLNKDASYSEEDVKKQTNETLELFEKLFSEDIFSQLLESEITKKEFTLTEPDEGFAYHWFFNAETKQLERFSKNVPVEIIDNHGEDAYLCYAKSKTYIVPKKYIKSEMEH